MHDSYDRDVYAIVSYYYRIYQNYFVYAQVYSSRHHIVHLIISDILSLSETRS